MWRKIPSLFKCRARGFSAIIPTVYALSSGQGKCGVAVIRVSGPRASEAILRMTEPKQLPEPRTASLRRIRDPETLEELDRGLVLWFPGPRSFTGEDSCEFQVHGGLAVVQSVLAGLSKLERFRPAEAGEFTRRAFFAGKLDLTEVEGLADLIHAETDLQRRQALYQMEGHLSVMYKKWRTILVKNMAHVEAFIDFSENENIEDDILQGVNEKLSDLVKEIRRHLSDGRKGERLRHGIQTTIIGEPNAGKSSLLNAICNFILSQEPVAIVTAQPGTTRDTVRMHLNVNGFPLTLIDTAGLRRDAVDAVEKEGISRAQKTLETADLVLVVIDASALPRNLAAISERHVDDYIRRYINNLTLDESHKKILAKSTDENDGHPKCMLLFNKTDLLSGEERNALEKVADGLRFKSNICCISCKSEEGFHKFIDQLTDTMESLCGNPTRENPTLTQNRHRHHLNATLQYLNEYFALIDEDATLAAQRLRLSLRHLGKIMGTVTNDEILDVIFKDFCVGK